MALHGEEEIPLGLVRGSAFLDRAPIAILSNRLSFNALLFRNTVAQNRQVLAEGARPLSEMRPVAQALTRFYAPWP